jgi:hypothetical protein
MLVHGRAAAGAPRHAGDQLVAGGENVRCGMRHVQLQLVAEQCPRELTAALGADDRHRSRNTIAARSIGSSLPPRCATSEGAPSTYDRGYSEAAERSVELFQSKTAILTQIGG